MVRHKLRTNATSRSVVDGRDREFLCSVWSKYTVYFYVQETIQYSIYLIAFPTVHFTHCMYMSCSVFS